MSAIIHSSQVVQKAGQLVCDKYTVLGPCVTMHHVIIIQHAGHSLRPIFCLCTEGLACPDTGPTVARNTLGYSQGKSQNNTSTL